MASKAAFSKKEWELVKDAPEWVRAALTSADKRAALLTQLKESKGFSKAVAGFETRSQLIREVIEDKSKPAKALKGATLSDAEDALGQIGEVLGRKLTREEADDFRGFLMAIGESLAASAGEGLLGVGDKISKKEAAALERIASALKATEADKRARAEAEARTKREAEEKAKREADAARKKQEAQAKAKREAEAAREKREAETKAKRAEAEAARKKRDAQAKEAKAKREGAEAEKKRLAEAKAEREAREAGEARRKKDVAEKAAAAEAAKPIAEHTVVSGDTLSGIALKYYGSAARDKWMLIYEENKGIIGDNPNLIRPGQVFRIPKLP